MGAELLHEDVDQGRDEHGGAEIDAADEGVGEGGAAVEGRVGDVVGEVDAEGGEVAPDEAIDAG